MSLGGNRFPWISAEFAIGAYRFGLCYGTCLCSCLAQLCSHPPLAERKDVIRPANAKRSAVKKILNVAALHFEELAALWEEVHGKA